MLQTPPWTLQAASHGAELFRRTTQSLLAAAGVVGGGDLAVTANGSPNMSVNVAAGEVWIPGTLGGTSAINITNVGAQTGYGLPSGFSTQGCYYTLNDGNVNLAVAAANPTNPRIDIVCASIQDSYYSGSSNSSVLQVVTGTPAPTPAPPSAPANTVVLAQVYVAANATQITTGNITDERPFASLAANPGLAPPSSTFGAGLNQSLRYLYGDTATTPCTPATGWTNGTPGLNVRRAGTLVAITGLVTNSSGSSQQYGTADSTVTTVPAGYVPANSKQLPSVSGTSAVNLTVTSSGTVVLNGGAAVAAGAVLYIGAVYSLI